MDHRELREPRVEVSGLVKRFGELTAVDRIDFALTAGQVCGYLGPNGAGKSTTLRMLAGILTPDAGSVRICGHDVAESPLAVKRCIGYLPESGALYSLLTVSEHLDLVADLHALEPAPAAQRASRLLALFGLRGLEGRRIDSLSRGQRQKVAICATLLPDPPVLLLDEPLQGLDVRAAHSLKELLRGLAMRGRIVLYSSHILDVVERLCDRTLILDAGRIAADAPTSELLSAAGDETLEGVFHALTRSSDLDGRVAAYLAQVEDARA